MSALESGLTAHVSKRVVLTGSVAVVTLLCMVVPRVGPLVVAALAIAVGGAFLVREFLRNDWRKVLRTVLLRPEMAFPIWTLVACLWAVAPSAALAKAIFLLVLVAHVIVLARHTQDLDENLVADVSRGLLLGFVLGALYLFVEITLRDSIGRWVLTHFPFLDRGLAKHGKMSGGVVTSVSGAHMTRVSAVFCLLWCPAVLAAVLYTKGAVKWLVIAVTAAVTLTVLAHQHSHSQTAELALFVGIVLLAVATLAPTVGRWIAGAAFTGVLFFIVPLSLAMFAAKLHENPDLFKSARARVVIWNYTAERVLENPVLGIGTNSTRYLDEGRSQEAKAQQKNLVVAAQTRAHPHNVYLQVWYELGIIGVLAFAVLGLSLLRRIEQLPKRTLAFAIGHFGVCSVVIASTYGLWQNWFQSSIVLSILLLILVANPGSKGPRDASTA